MHHMCLWLGVLGYCEWNRFGARCILDAIKGPRISSDTPAFSSWYFSSILYTFLYCVLHIYHCCYSCCVFIITQLFSLLSVVPLAYSKQILHTIPDMINASIRSYPFLQVRNHYLLMGHFMADRVLKWHYLFLPATVLIWIFWMIMYHSTFWWLACLSWWMVDWVKPLPLQVGNVETSQPPMLLNVDISSFDIIV